APRLRVWDRRGANHQAHPRYRQAKATKCGGTGGEKSERLIVLLNQGNRTCGKPGEGRGRRVVEPLEGNMPGASEPDPVSTKQQRIAALAKQSPHMGFTSLAHHIDLRWLYAAYLRTRKDGAVGVDGQTAEDYAANLRGNLESLLERAKSGTYRAPPVRRVHIPKADSSTETRPS